MRSKYSYGSTLNEVMLGDTSRRNLLDHFLNESPSYISVVNNSVSLCDFSEVVDIDIEDNGDGTVNIYYTVADAGDYTLSIKFGGQPVPDGFYTFTVSSRKGPFNNSDDRAIRQRVMSSDTCSYRC